MRPEPRRGFRRERHTALKLCACLLAAAGFIAAWGGLAASHEPSLSPGPQPTPSAVGLATSVSTSDETSDQATPTARPRTSRGS